MTEQNNGTQILYPAMLRIAPTRFRGPRKALFAAIVGINLAIIIWLWMRDGGVAGIHTGGDLLTSIGRITGLLGAYALLIQLLLLARMRWLERLIGFDRLTAWHKINGKTCLYLIVAHVVVITIGYALLDQISIPGQVQSFLQTYPDMIQATIGTVLIVVVAASSFVIVRKRLRYEIWYFVHLTAYVAVFLGWLHQIPTGNEFILSSTAAAYWTGLYLATLILLVLFRLALPTLRAFRHQMKVAEVVVEGPDVVSLRITGHNLDRMPARAGQFFLWCFITWRLVWQSHPFSLSSAPDGQSLRITVKSLGDFTRRIGEIKPGTRVFGVGPFGLFTDEV